MDIPYNAKINIEATGENSARVQISEGGRVPEEITDNNNPIIPIRRLIGEPQE